MERRITYIVPLTRLYYVTHPEEARVTENITYLANYDTNWHPTDELICYLRGRREKVTKLLVHSFDVAQCSTVLSIHLYEFIVLIYLFTYVHRLRKYFEN